VEIMNLNQAIIELYRFTKLNKGLLNFADIAKIFGCTRGYPAKLAKENKELNEDQIMQLEHRFNFHFFDRESAIKRLEAISKIKPVYIGDYDEFTLYDLQELAELHNVNLNYLLCGVGDMFIKSFDEQLEEKKKEIEPQVKKEASEMFEEMGLFVGDDGIVRKKK